MWVVFSFYSEVFRVLFFFDLLNSGKIRLFELVLCFVVFVCVLRVGLCWNI